MIQRRDALPVFVTQDSETKGTRGINGLHVQTFIPNPFGSKKGTLITFASGDKVTVADDFDVIADLMMGRHVDG